MIRFIFTDMAPAPDDKHSIKEQKIVNNMLSLKANVKVRFCWHFDLESH
jgi:hypothetical protein